MCSCYQSNKNPQEVKLTLDHRSARPRPNFSTKSDMLRFDAVRVSPPAYPFNFQTFQRAVGQSSVFSSNLGQQNNSKHPNLGRPCHCASNPSALRFRRSLRSDPASLRRLVFGEAVSRPTHKNPQEGK